MSDPLLLIGGPTGSGKSQLALEIAHHFPSEIINADSRQIYRDLVIGTNQPSAEVRQTVPHHLFAFHDPASPFSAADYERLALPLVRRILAAGKLPVVVGGTGFYMKALLRGVWSVPPRDPEWRERLQRIEAKRGREFLHRLLQRLDPPSASSIKVQDVYRVIRALEIFFQTGKRRSRLVPERRERFATLKFYLDPDRKVLLENVRQRTESMFQEGWIEEVRALMEKYPDFERMPAAASIGYHEIVRHLRGEVTLQTCKETIVRKTSQYAKRQLTWFRNQDRFVQLAGSELHKIVESVLQWRRNS